MTIGEYVKLNSSLSSGTALSLLQNFVATYKIDISSTSKPFNPSNKYYNFENSITGKNFIVDKKKLEFYDNTLSETFSLKKGLIKFSRIIND